MFKFFKKKSEDLKVDKVDNVDNVDVNVVFKLTDGKRPTRAGAALAFNLRAPIDIRVPAGMSMKIDMGILCSHPLLVFQPAGLESSEIIVSTDSLVIDHNKKIVVNVKNNGKSEYFFSEGETIVRAVVLDNSKVTMSYT